MKKNNKISTKVINGIKTTTMHIMVQDINSNYPDVYEMNGYGKVSEEILKSCKDMAVCYTGMTHFGGYYGEDGIFYLYSISNTPELGGYHDLWDEEIDEAYYNAGCPKNIHIMKYNDGRNS